MTIANFIKCSSRDSLSLANTRTPKKEKEKVSHHGCPLSVFLRFSSLSSPAKIFFFYSWIEAGVRRVRADPSMALSRLRQPLISRAPSLLRARFVSSSLQSRSFSLPFFFLHLFHVHCIFSFSYVLNYCFQLLVCSGNCCSRVVYLFLFVGDWLLWQMVWRIWITF